MVLKSLEGELVVRGHKNRAWHPRRRDLSHNSESIEQGHVNVEINEIGRELPDHLDGIAPVSGGAHHFNIVFTFE